MKKALEVFLCVLLTFCALLCLVSCGGKDPEKGGELVGVYRLESYLAQGGRSDADELEIEAKIELKDDRSGEFVYKRCGYSERFNLKWSDKYITFRGETPVKFEWHLKGGTLTLKELGGSDSKVLIFQRTVVGGEEESAQTESAQPESAQSEGSQSEDAQAKSGE